MSSAGVVWVASYPKSGSTWTRALISSLLAGGAPPDLDGLSELCPVASSIDLIEEWTGLTFEDLVETETRALRRAAHLHVARTAQTPRLLKVHDRYDAELFPREAIRAIIYIVRDPRDVAPSLANHMSVDIERAIEVMATPSFTFASTGRHRSQTPQRASTWSAHVSSWLDGPKRPRLLLRYEDMIANAERETRRLAEFLDVEADAEVIRAAATACAFPRLREREARDGFVERPPNVELFFRRGVAGGWREALTAEQARRIEAEHGPVMRRLGYLAGAAR